MKLAAVFSDHMVLQRDKTVYIWGQAAPGQTVHAEIQKQYGEDTVKADGSFCIGIGPLQTSWAEELAVICGDEKAVIRDVQVGEVWLAGGQSNMEYLMSHQQGIEEEQELLRRLGRKPELRFFDVPEISYPRRRRTVRLQPVRFLADLYTGGYPVLFRGVVFLRPYAGGGAGRSGRHYRMQLGRDTELQLDEGGDNTCRGRKCVDR